MPHKTELFMESGSHYIIVMSCHFYDKRITLENCNKVYKFWSVSYINHFVF
jgi:hypothetical protein